MGVDWYACTRCGDTFPDCGPRVRCGNDCGREWCRDKCADADGRRKDSPGDDENDPVVTCKYCRGEDCDDSVLLAFLLDLFPMTREAAVWRWRNRETCNACANR